MGVTTKNKNKTGIIYRICKLKKDVSCFNVNIAYKMYLKSLCGGFFFKENNQIGLQIFKASAGRWVSKNTIFN